MTPAHDHELWTPQMTPAHDHHIKSEENYGQ